MAFTLVLNSSETYDLPTWFIPVKLFDFERDIYSVKTEGMTVRQGRGDGGVKPFRITLKGTVHKNQLSDLNSFLRSINFSVVNTVELRYDTLKISIEKGWTTFKTNPAQPNMVDIEILLIPLYPDIPNWTVGSTYWGETSWFMDSTSVLLGDT